ncbi:MAG: hypothetical protein H0V32_12880 [Nocardioidaceae bacterium]|jgi:hypothetical protein|nr:hypothetical protein [Nocardioidaceae bacterium]MDQ3430736.1 hypothetical protein [Actinomycetota bacterium]
MPANEPDVPDTGRRHCPVCWTWFTPNSPSNPYPRRYCCGACRIADSRRRRENEETQLLLDAKLDLLRATRHADAARRETTRLRRLLDERNDSMNAD